MDDHRFKVRIGHFVPDAPTVDFLADGRVVLGNREHGDIPAYTEHSAGTYDIGARLVNTGDIVIEQPITFHGGTHYTLLFVGRLEDPEFRLLVDGG